jgi:hypothetical protein
MEAIFKFEGAATVDDLIDLATSVVRFGHDAVSQKSRSEKRLRDGSNDPE